MIIPWIEGSLLLTQVAFLAVAVVSGKDGADIQVSLAEAVPEQSITFRGEFLNYVPSRTVDQDLETCSRTASTRPRWWRLTLKNPLNVSRILVIGGKDIRGQELQMDKVNVTIAPDNQSPASECKLSEFLAVEDDHEWHQFNCSKENSARIIHISDLRQLNTEFSLCEIKVYEKIAPPDDIEKESLISDRSAAYEKTRSNKIFSLGFFGFTLLLTKWML